MKVRHLLLLITQNAMSTVPKLVPAWQLEVYQEKYGETLGDAPEEQIVELDALPEAEEELARMQGIFGGDPETKQSYVDLVFGRGTRALRDLEKAMQDAVVPDEDAPAQKATNARKAKAVKGAPETPAETPAADAALAALAGEGDEKDPLAQ